MIKENIEDNLKKYFKEISDKITRMIIESDKRYFAYMIESNTELCNHEGYDYQINYKCFDDENCIYLLRHRGYVVVDAYNI